jgi:hypothetical protein
MLLLIVALDWQNKAILGTMYFQLFHYRPIYQEEIT